MEATAGREAHPQGLEAPSFRPVKEARSVLFTEESVGFWRLSVPVEAVDDCVEAAVISVTVTVTVLLQSERGF